ncbi:hypothetical protein HA466_0094830 [Hirschfeldia incana]|nr:hypothetical protein HA466_0094830 [Hirschfeldia incana]
MLVQFKKGYLVETVVEGNEIDSRGRIVAGSFQGKTGHSDGKVTKRKIGDSAGGKSNVAAGFRDGPSKRGCQVLQRFLSCLCSSFAALRVSLSTSASSTGKKFIFEHFVLDLDRKC